jgi:hypothetical protein
VSVDVPKVVRDLQQLVVLVLQVTKKMPKSWRPSLAQRMETYAIETFLSVRHFALASRREKSQMIVCLHEAVAHMDHLEALLAVCHECKILSDGQCGDLTGAVVDIRKQLFGLKKNYDPPD